MATGILETTLPIYHNAMDWEAFFKDYPVPDVFAETVFQWPMNRVRDLQNERFMKTMQIGWRNEFYRRRWEAAGLQPSDVRGLEDITKLPYFTSDDIKDDQKQHPPFGKIQGVTLADLVTTPMKLQQSGGTTGKPRRTLFGPIEWELNALTNARSAYIQGARPGDVMQIPVTCSLANLGWGYYKACLEYLGVLPLTTGSGVVTPSLRQLQEAFELGTNIWMSFPEYLTKLAEVCRNEMGRDLRELRTKFLTSFMGPDTEGTLRRQLEEQWGCPVYDNYGAHEIALAGFECQKKDGLHLMEDCVYFEFIGDDGKPMKSGEDGELVLTVLYRKIPPMIRYKIRDRGRIISEKTCACGGTFRRMDHFLGRSDDMVKLRGTNIYPMACLPAIKSDPRTTGEWVCVVDRLERDGVFREEMTVRVETRQDATNLAGLREHLEKRLLNDLGAKVTVELVGTGTLAEFTNVNRVGDVKAKRLLDRRYKK